MVGQCGYTFKAKTSHRQGIDSKKPFIHSGTRPSPCGTDAAMRQDTTPIAWLVVRPCGPPSVEDEGNMGVEMLVS